MSLIKDPENRRFFWDILFLGLFSAVLYFPCLGITPFWDYDEAYFATTAREMFNSGDWVVPRFSENEYADKPILMFFTFLLSFSLFGGVSEYAARFPAALWGVGSVLLTYFMGLRLFNRAVACRAAVILATMLMFTLEARSASSDGLLTFWVLAAMTCYTYGVWRKKSADVERIDAESVLCRSETWFPRSLFWIITLYASMGMASLAKGPVGFLFPAACIGMFMLIKRLTPYDGNLSGFLGAFIKMLRPFHPIHFMKTCCQMKILTGAAIILLVAGPWYFYVGWKTHWEWTHMFFIGQNLDRVTTVMGRHSGPFFYYIPALLMGIFPWSVFFIPVCCDFIHRLRSECDYRDALIFLLSWSGVTIIGFSCLATKLPSYIVIMYPAVALIFGLFFTDWVRNVHRFGDRHTWLALLTLATVGGMLGVVFLWGIPCFLPGVIPQPQVLAWTACPLILAALCVAAMFCAGIARIYIERVMVAWFTVFLFILLVWGGWFVASDQHYDKMMDAVRRECPNANIFSVDCHEPSWSYTFGKTIPVVSACNVQRLLNENPDNAYFIVTSLDYPEVERSVTNLREVTRVKYFLENCDLIVFTANKNTNER